MRRLIGDQRFSLYVSGYKPGKKLEIIRVIRALTWLPMQQVKAEIDQFRERPRVDGYLVHPLRASGTPRLLVKERASESEANQLYESLSEAGGLPSICHE
jgi:hypothetical protein